MRCGAKYTTTRSHVSVHGTPLHSTTTPQWAPTPQTRGRQTEDVGTRQRMRFLAAAAPIDHNQPQPQPQPHNTTKQASQRCRQHLAAVWENCVPDRQLEQKQTTWRIRARMAKHLCQTVSTYACRGLSVVIQYACRLAGASLSSSSRQRRSRHTCTASSATPLAAGGACCLLVAAAGCCTACSGWCGGHLHCGCCRELDCDSRL